ncbi:tetratricopeptide repeat protein [Chitinibacter sp. SCUT-21]|uniref:tetratricopeptide repeat protein n=1 Tax=Chitinibacter sp. SCUT-21 TaxID=2970891 RepID=UPI0035A71594
MNSDQRLIESLYEQSKRLIYTDPSASLHLINQAVDLLPAEVDPQFRIAVVYQQIEMLTAIGRIHEALILLHQTLVIAETENLEVERGNLLYHIGIAHYTTGDFGTALDFWRDCLNLENEGFSAATRINTHISVGQLYFAFHMPEDALRHHQQAMKWVDSQIESELYVRVLINLVADLYELGRYDEALSYLDEAEPQARAIEHFEYVGEALGYRTMILLAQNRLDEIASILEQGHAMERYWAWGEISWKVVTGKILQAQHEYSQAIECFLEALALSNKYECTSKVHIIHSVLAHAYGDMGNHELAEKHQRLYQEHFKRLGSPEIFARLQQLEVQLENT